MVQLGFSKCFKKYKKIIHDGFLKVLSNKIPHKGSQHFILDPSRHHSGRLPITARFFWIMEVYHGFPKVLSKQSHTQRLQGLHFRPLRPHPNPNKIFRNILPSSSFTIFFLEVDYVLLTSPQLLPAMVRHKHPVIATSSRHFLPTS